MLHLPTEPVYTAYEQVSDGITHHPDGSSFLTRINDLAIDLGDHPGKVNYGRRRRAFADWTIEPADWQAIIDELREASNSTQRRLIDWGERKRNTASALVWIHATQAEHLFAPHRHSPGARPGSVQDRGLSIDRAWWRANQPGRHYAELKRACNELAGRLTAQLDRTGQLTVVVAN
jgi:hypothetical protein